MGAIEEMSRKGEEPHILSNVVVDVAVGESDFATMDANTSTLWQ